MYRLISFDMRRNHLQKPSHSGSLTQLVQIRKCVYNNNAECENIDLAVFIMYHIWLALALVLEPMYICSSTYISFCLTYWTLTHLLMKGHYYKLQIEI